MTEQPLFHSNMALITGSGRSNSRRSRVLPERPRRLPLTACFTIGSYARTSALAYDSAMDVAKGRRGRSSRF